MQRLAVIGCALLGLLMPGGSTQAAVRKVKQGLRPVESDVEFQASPEYETDAGRDYGPEPSWDYGPQGGCGRRFAPEPSCGCTPEPHCGCGPCEPGPGLGLCGLWDCMLGDLWGACDAGCDACGGGSCGCFEPCVHSSGLWIAAEVLWFRYHRADGVRVGRTEPEDEAEFDFEITPRFTAGWVRSDGLGGRGRYWEFNHSAPAFEGGGSLMNVDTYTLDLEVFDTFCLNRNWDLEIAAGVRYTDFLEEMFDIAGDDDFRLNSFSGYGGLVGGELRRCIGASGVVWGRLRAAILMDDKDVANDPGQGQQVRLLDVTVGMTEVAFGYNYVLPMSSGAYAFVGVQAEWQNWYNFSSSFEDTENDEDFSGPSDVGFGGFGAVVGWAR